MEAWGEEIFPEGVGVKGKMGHPPPPAPTSPLHQSSTGQPSKMAASNPILLSSVPLENNACTAGYLSAGRSLCLVVVVGGGVIYLFN